MRRIFSVTLLVASLCIQTVQHGSAQEPGKITVTGEAELRVAPDEVVLSMGLETSDMDLTAAKALNDERVTGVLAVARTFSIPSPFIQTDYAGIEPRYRDWGEGREFLGYFVSKTITFTVRDLSRFEELLSAVLAAGVNYIYGMEFRTIRLREYRDRARVLAVNAARDKAKVLTGELGHTIGKPLAIAEETDRWAGWHPTYSGYGRSAMTQNVIQSVEGPAVSGGSLEPGMITITSRVTVTFEISGPQDIR